MASPAPSEGGEGQPAAEQGKPHAEKDALPGQREQKRLRHKRNADEPDVGREFVYGYGLAPVPWIDEAGQGGHGRRKIEARKESEGEEYGTGHVQAVGQRHEQKGQSGKDQGKGRHAARKHPAEEKTAHKLGDAEAQALHEQERSGGRVTDLQIPFDADQKGTQRGASGIVEPEEHGDEGSPGEGAAEIIGGQGRMSWRSARTVQDTAHIVFRRLLN